MSFELKGFDQLQRTLKQATEALAALDGDLVSLNFDPNDQDSIDQALATVDRAVDEKIAPYIGNKWVDQIAAEVKQKLKEGVLQRVNELRTGASDTADKSGDT